MSEALEKHFPCGGCLQYLATEGEHLRICPVNYRRRAVEMLQAMGLA